MPEETKTNGNTEAEAKELVFKEPISVPRNDVTVDFTQQWTTKGAEPGKMVFEPSVADEAILLTWVGVPKHVAEALKSAAGVASTTMSNVVGILRQKLRAFTLEIAKDQLELNTDPDNGILDEANFIAGFIKDMQEFDSAGETLGDLKEKRDELNDAMRKLDFSQPESQELCVELGKKIQEIQRQIVKKSRGPRKAKTTSPQPVAA